MAPSLEGRVHDPLWLLGRQWQVGEFQGEDAGTPVAARLRGRTEPVTGWSGGDFDGSVPLEALVEAEDPAPDARLAAETGQHLLRMLDGDRRAAIRAAYPLPRPDPGLDPDSYRYLSVMAGRVPDGDAVAAALRDGTLAADDDLNAWLAWYDALVVRPAAGQATWQPSRMEYTFAATTATATLTSTEYADGRLDWYAFSMEPGQAPATAAGEDLVATSLAAPASYPGMPARRWWQFEDSRVDFGGIEAAPEDLARLLLAEFATAYGNDWYLLPLEIPVGSLTAVHSLVVADTFGEHTLVERVRDPDWSMFEVSRSDAGPGNETRADRLLLAPALGWSLDGEPVEDVLFTRDERANIAWAIERVVEGAAGGRIDRLARWQATAPATPDDREPAPGEAIAYRLMTPVPDYWIPLLPVETAPGRVALRRGAVRRPTPAGDVEIAPEGRLLLPGRPLTIAAEEVPREGATITRAWQYARWIDGSSHLWQGRRKRPGRGESSAALVFDRIVARP
jgi:hypothetical protein